MSKLVIAESLKRNSEEQTSRPFEEAEGVFIKSK